MRTNIQNNRRPVIGITMGDPVGVGPEIILIGLRDPAVFLHCRPLILGDLNQLQNAQMCTGTRLNLTELIAEKTDTTDVVMMFTGGRLNVALVTIHVPFKIVPTLLTTGRILKTIMITEPHTILQGPEKGIPEVFGPPSVLR